MAKRSAEDEVSSVDVDLSESSVYGNDAESEEEQFAPEDIATTATIDRLEEITGGADEEEEQLPVTGRLDRQIDALDASADEEIDALQLDLTQEDERPNRRDGSGGIVDDVAEERLAEFTEVGRDLDEEGAESVVPGLDDTSQVLREHHPNTEFARADAVVEGNFDEPRDEELDERKADEGTAG
ncbi:MAG TPA: hypothetical protein VIM62_08540 [Acidobacteriaceae bacterium]